MPPQNATQAFFRYLTTRLYLVRTPCWAQSCRTASRSLNAITRQSSSSTRWKSRQGRDSFAREAKVQGLKSRAAFKLLEIDAKYKIFRRGQTVVDLGYAPGSWSQVAVERTKPSGRIVGIDIIPAQPPKGVSTIQGNFLSTEVQNEVKRFMRDADGGRPSMSISYNGEGEEIRDEDEEGAREENFRGRGGRKEVPVRVVDVVLSDMDEPWPQTTGFYKRSLSDPYYRMMNTTGINFKDHAGSMDLCSAALIFAYDALKVGGHFVCKFYQGSEDKDFENSLRKMFATVHREKPESSRSESKEAYFVALRRKPDRKKDVDGKEGHGTEETEFLDDDYDLKEVGEKVENSEEADEAK